MCLLFNLGVCYTNAEELTFARNINVALHTRCRETFPVGIIVLLVNSDVIRKEKWRYYTTIFLFECSLTWYSVM